MTNAGKRLIEGLLRYDDLPEDRIGWAEDWVEAIEAEAVAAERARIRAAVEGLPGESLPVYDDDEGRIALWKDMVDRAAVLAAVSGEAAAAIDGEDEVYIGPIQHSNAQCWSKDDPTCHCWCAVCERHNR